jgi:hypothetical protein
VSRIRVTIPSSHLELQGVTSLLKRLLNSTSTVSRGLPHEEFVRFRHVLFHTTFLAKCLRMA